MTFGYMFSYSERPNTQAQRKFEDDVSVEIKKVRLQEIVDLQRKHSKIRVETRLNKTHKVLVEGFSKKSKEHLYGRTTFNTVVVFPKENYKPGDYVLVKANTCTSATLIGKAVKLA